MLKTLTIMISLLVSTAAFADAKLVAHFTIPDKPVADFTYRTMFPDVESCDKAAKEDATVKAAIEQLIEAMKENAPGSEYAGYTCSLVENQ